VEVGGISRIEVDRVARLYLQAHGKVLLHLDPACIRRELTAPIVEV
jgi:hypothetical protein